MNQTFDIIEKTLLFIEDYLNISLEEFPTIISSNTFFLKEIIDFFLFELDLLGVPDLILDEKASSSWGFITFREEFLAVDESLNSAERLQTTTKSLVEHILQIV